MAKGALPFPLDTKSLSWKKQQKGRLEDAFSVGSPSTGLPLSGKDCSYNHRTNLDLGSRHSRWEGEH